MQTPHSLTLSFESCNALSIVTRNPHVHSFFYYYGIHVILSNKELAPELPPEIATYVVHTSHSYADRAATSLPKVGLLVATCQHRPEMAQNGKALLLMLWKNFVLQVRRSVAVGQLLFSLSLQIRRPVGTAVELVTPILLVGILVALRY